MNELPIRWYKYNQDSGKFEPQITEIPDNVEDIGITRGGYLAHLHQTGHSPTHFDAPLTERQIEQIRAIVQEELVKAGVIRTGFKGGLKG